MTNDTNNTTDPLAHQWSSFLPAGATLAPGTARLVVAKPGDNNTTNHDNAILVQAATSLRPHAVALVVGRQAATADLRIQHGSISRQHALLYYTTMNDDKTSSDSGSDNNKSIQLWVHDLGGKHGTTVNGVKIDKKTAMALQQGDQVQFGNVRESCFVVMFVDDKKNGDGDTTTTTTNTTAAAAHEPQPKQESAKQQLEQAGEGLSGRAKREAELKAMMESLDATPVYQSNAAATTNDASEQQQQQQQQHQQSSETQQNASNPIIQQHKLPVAETFDIPSPTADTDGADTDARQQQQQHRPVTCLAMDPQGARWALGDSKYLHLFAFSGMDQRRRSPYATTTPEDGHGTVAVTFSNTGDRLLVATGSAQPVVLHREAGGDDNVVIQFVRGDMYVADKSQTSGHTAAVTSVAWHPLERQYCLTGSTDGTARLWNLDGKTQFEKLVCDKVFTAKNKRGHRTQVACVAFHPGGREFAVGTTCGSLQVWNAQRALRAERMVHEAHGGGSNKPISSVAYSNDGTRLATRSHGDSRVLIWNATRLSNSSRPLVACVGLPTLHEAANFAWSPDGKYGCAGASAFVPQQSQQGSGNPPKKLEMGSLNFYKIENATTASSSTSVVEPLFDLEMVNVSPIMVQWHKQLNQIVVGCSDGDVRVYYDPTLSKNGALLAVGKAGRAVDDLSALLNSRAPQGLASVTGDIVTPLAQPRKRKRRGEDEPVKAELRTEPERPATGKHKVGGSNSGVKTYAQYIADQHIEKSKKFAGSDPRQALMKYADPQQLSEQEQKKNGDDARGSS